MKSGIFLVILLVFSSTYSQRSSAEKYKSTSQSTASLQVVVKNDSDTESWLRRITVSVFDPKECINPKARGKVFARLNPKRSAELSSKVISIDADKDLALNFFYIDAAYARNRICAVTGTVKLKAGVNYVAEFDIEKSIETCKVAFGPAASNLSEQTDFTVMPVVCPVSEDPLISGIGRGIVYQVRVQ